MIPIARPSITEREVDAVARVVASGALAQGAEVAAFEAEFADAVVGGRTTVAVSSGTAALHLLLLAHGLGPGDEVIVPSFTFAATANVVKLVGAEPVFADIDACFCLDPDAVAAALTPRTAAVIAVHLYGQPADMSGLREVARRGQVLLLEDAAQAHGAALRGAPVGTLGDGAAFSFYPTKNMTTGEGGAVVLEDPDAVRTVRLLRNQGMDEQYEHEVVGFNLRMTEMSAALGRVQLERFAELTATRQGNAARYDAALAGGPVQAPVVRDGATHVYHQYTVRTGERDALADRLHALGVQSRVYYPTPLHQQLPFRGTAADLPETERATREVLSVPVGPHLAAADVECIADALGATT